MIHARENCSFRASGRVEFLDGIRGWASFMVLLSHLSFLVPLPPDLMSDNTKEFRILNNIYINALLNDLFKFITDGHLAVLIFFVLSGYALSVNHVHAITRKLSLSATSRYFRLMIPVLSTSLVAYLLIKLGLMRNLSVATQMSWDWLGSFYTIDWTLIDVIKFSLFDVFFRFKYNSDNTFNPILWTMHIEIVGSFMIYSYLAIFRSTEKTYWRLVLPLTLLLFFIYPFFCCFFIGYIIAELDKDQRISHTSYRLKKINADVIFLTIFILMAVLSTHFRENDYETCFFASCIVMAISFSKKLKYFFSNKLSQYLGRISFTLYLIQIPIICSWSSYVYIELVGLGVERGQSDLVNLVSTILLCLLAATLLLPVEKFSVAAAKKIGNFFINGKALRLS